MKGKALLQSAMAMAALSCVIPGTASAQDGATDVEQLSPARSPDDARLPAQSQIASPGRDRLATSDVDPATRADPATPVPQLSDRRDRRGPVQLYRGGRTAQPSDPLSTPSQGRTSAVARVEGDDACDPARAEEREDARCARVIETRSAEFTPPEPTPLSPEQRLLVENRLRNSDATRRLANSGSADTLGDQAIASVALDAARPPDPAAPEEDPTQGLDPAVAAMVEAIARQVTPP